MRNVFAGCAGLVIALAGAGHAQDLSGFYGGLSVATHDGEHQYDNVDSSVYGVEGPAFGGFVGYMISSGALSYGVEFSASKGGVYEYETDGSESYKDEYEYSRFMDLKGRIGYTMDKTFVYATLGLSRAKFVSDVDNYLNTNGQVYGLGADYAINDKMFVGAEYLHRNYDFYDAFQDANIDASINSLTLRAGFKF